MTTEEKMAALRRPFYSNEIEWRTQSCGITNNGKPWAVVLAYITNRAIMNRLDEVFGIDGWRNEFVKWGDGATLCGISCRIGEEWITKWDGASETDIEATKGGLSDSMKRAAVQWGIGRYLYSLTENFATCSMEKQQGNGWKQAKTKDGKYFYWCPPALPDWALPKEDHGKGNQQPQGNSNYAPQGHYRQPQQQPQTPPVNNAPAKSNVITQKQRNLLFAKGKEKGFTNEEMSFIVFETVGVNSSAEIPIGEFNTVLAAFDAAEPGKVM